MAYTLPLPADLKARYTAFADVADDTVQVWLTDAERFVDESWIEGDYAPAIMALAAHNLSLEGHGTTAGVQLPAGVKDFRSGSMSVSMSEAAANAQASGGYNATRYGAEFKRLQRRNFGGPRVIATGTTACTYY